MASKQVSGSIPARPGRVAEHERWRAALAWKAATGMYSPYCALSTTGELVCSSWARLSRPGTRRSSRTSSASSSTILSYAGKAFISEFPDLLSLLLRHPMHFFVRQEE